MLQSHFGKATVQPYLWPADQECGHTAQSVASQLTAHRMIAQAQQAEEEILGLLIPRDSADEKGVVLEVRAGTGGEEAALFASDLFNMYQRFAEQQRWKFEVSTDLLLQ